MKILIANDTEAAHYYDRIAWLKVFRYCGFECEIWDVRTKSAFDAFDEYEPDVFFGQLHNFDRATIKNILARPNLKVAAKAGHWGNVDKDVDVNKYPVFVASDEHKKIAETLVKSGNLKYIFVHYPQESLEYTMGNWRNIVEPVSLMNACDTFSYLGGEYKELFASDLSIVSGYWPYKAQNLNKWILPLCLNPGEFNIRIYGNSHWPVAQYVGPVAEENVKHIFSSSKINLDCHEPHTVDFDFDLTERVFKVCGAGGFYLSLGKPNACLDIFPDIPYVLNVKDLKDWIYHWLSNESNKEKQEVAKHHQKLVLDDHTYFNRCALALQTLGCDEWLKIEKDRLKVVNTIL